ncbi:NAD-dependent protein deacylase [Hydrogenophaga sp. PAMC20947]|uniref:NAD-dependent protein deacylase n=1 Tax=Hydrogenophaga sp. PAMC20947 TaxID=2565558 RepID=UPI00109D881C|nr:NAD-dependent protein deacylase [Hydrogenophaga sp. PAMC20947]QCB45271.1 NAD-dependent protein deacylase [Hydrogenophaga sp. PAMC20947]
MEMGRDTVRVWINEARHVAVLTGAGVSAESGVPTFRDAQTGLWAQFDPQELATEAAYRAHPERVWDWYAHRRAMLTKAEPNAGHLALAAFARRHPGRLSLITQNVDGLHQRAGQPDTMALHGALGADRWLDAPRACCEAQAPQDGRPPACATCGNLRRPAVVWFGENLPADALGAAESAVADCDLMLVVGTSGQVYPAAGLALAAQQQGARLVMINPEPTELDSIADACLREPSARCLPYLLKEFL